MSIIDQAKEVADTVVDKVKDKELGDDFLADYIIKYASKQEHINEILESKGSSYRIGSMEVEVGVPPKVTFAIEKQPDDTAPG